MSLRTCIRNFLSHLILTRSLKCVMKERVKASPLKNIATHTLPLLCRHPDRKPMTGIQSWNDDSFRALKPRFTSKFWEGPQRLRAPQEVEWHRYLLFLVFRPLPFLVPFLVFPRARLFLLVLLVLLLLLFLFRWTFFYAIVLENKWGCELLPQTFYFLVYFLEKNN